MRIIPLASYPFILDRQRLLMPEDPIRYRHVSKTKEALQRYVRD